MTTTYLCMWRGKEIQVTADSSYEAQQKAQKIFGAKKGWEIILLPIERNGKEVITKTMGGYFG